MLLIKMYIIGIVAIIILIITKGHKPPRALGICADMGKNVSSNSPFILPIGWSRTQGLLLDVRPMTDLGMSVAGLTESVCWLADLKSGGVWLYDQFSRPANQCHFWSNWTTLVYRSGKWRRLPIQLVALKSRSANQNPLLLRRSINWAIKRGQARSMA